MELDAVQEPWKRATGKKIKEVWLGRSSAVKGAAAACSYWQGWKQMGGSQFRAEMCSCPIPIAAALARTRSEDVQEKGTKQQPEDPDGEASVPLEVHYLRDVPKPHVKG